MHCAPSSLTGLPCDSLTSGAFHRLVTGCHHTVRHRPAMQSVRQGQGTSIKLEHILHLEPGAPLSPIPPTVFKRSLHKRVFPGISIYISGCTAYAFSTSRNTIEITAKSKAESSYLIFCALGQREGYARAKQYYRISLFTLHFGEAQTSLSPS